MSPSGPGDRSRGKKDEDAARRAADGDGTKEPQVTASGWSGQARPPRRRSFPGPVSTDVPLRVTMSRQAYADVSAHAKRDLNVEVCGVLVGELCEDDAGLFVSVEAIIEGSSTRQGASHVTYTQETWERIHAEMDRQYRKRQIVGWYHTHPGFGVQFSEMDLFIQRHFFSGPAQIAFVIDPLGGAEALCANTDQGIQSLSRFWVEGRERQSASAELPICDANKPASDADVARSLRVVEERLTQMMKALEESRQAWHRALLTLGALIAAAIIVLVVVSVYNQVLARRLPPSDYRFMPVPVRVGDKWVYLGAKVVTWDVPPEVEAQYLDHLKALIEEQNEASKAATQPSGSGPAESAGDSLSGPEPAKAGSKVETGPVRP
jgi:proteasome lid subunit RPN8/RPN11